MEHGIDRTVNGCTDLFCTSSKQHFRKKKFLCFYKAVMRNRLTTLAANSSALTEVAIINKILIIPYWRLQSSVLQTTPFDVVIRIIT